MNKHIFAILAYKESPFLQACIDSLKKQTAQSEIIICTSTPSVFLENIAQANNLHLFINPQRKGIANDWNFALNSAKSEYVTLAHQDDIYHASYAQKILAAGEKFPNNLIIYSDYDEMVHKENTTFLRKNSLNFFIKKILGELGFLGRTCLAKHKKYLLFLGSPIGCPAVTYHKSNLDTFAFDADFKINLDWKAWHDLAQKSGSFVWLRETLMTHRIHLESETSQGLKENNRQTEDLKMFTQFWPTPLAKLLSRLYALSYKNNN